MSDDFAGELTQRIDGKGRVSIPADFREVMEARDADCPEDKPARFILQYSDSLKGHLRGWSVDAISSIRNRIRKMPNGPDKSGLTFLYTTQTTRLTVDKDGRTVIPLEHREKLGLTEGDLAFLGHGDYFEIWRADAYRATKSAEIARWLDSKPGDFDPLSLIDDIPEE